MQMKKYKYVFSLRCAVLKEQFTCLLYVPDQTQSALQEQSWIGCKCLALTQKVSPVQEKHRVNGELVNVLI